MADDETPDAPDAAEEPQPSGPVLSSAHQELLARLGAELGDAVVESAATVDDLVVRVRPDAWRRTAAFLHDHHDFDYLSFVSAIDWMPAPLLAEEGSGDTSAPVQPRDTTYGAAGSAGRFQVFAHVESTRRHLGVTLKTDVDDADPRAESWVSVYPGADWHERECWEMYGIVFDGHPSLRRLYLPAEFEGHPLRKDFPLLSREVKPWPGLVDVEAMPGEPAAAEEGADA
ncbi:MAG TPA: NADH-quinone oxidoreductase subunit C [Acidimicrobiia bacterium]|nr:NADH-quinone oxidoreductase subunit C [Acidimicrobiia bacterium]